ncbi:spheroidene monooxygenase [Thalassococcus lentus]|uniref:Spheroidene monooxygenase n=1 Tax=Thalassococcus lentus TaxID=1210524 RepID=A0ABT4XN65_9RHOB|nr:spheroidene monooxygenase [Thalassococcus lentus]MDA7423387.1 spheroidene monooxygenase [Thalassococcus lentus]
MQTVSLSLFRFDGLSSRLWALAMMGAARLSLPRIDGLSFWKLCGSGTGEGFTPVPNTAVYAILCVWDDLHTARTALQTQNVFARYRARAAEDWTVFLNPISSRGEWANETPFVPQDDSGAGPIAALTRATLKPSIAMKFWGQVPDISAVIGSDPNVIFKIGIGEVPLLHQVTFSIWPDTASMANFARKDGPHAKAIAAVRDGQWFREELYARFRIAGETGSWDGQSPRILKEVQR